MTISVNSAAGAKGNEANFVTDANGNVTGLARPDASGAKAIAFPASPNAVFTKYGATAFDITCNETYAGYATSVSNATLSIANERTRWSPYSRKIVLGASPAFAKFRAASAGAPINVYADQTEKAFSIALYLEDAPTELAAPNNPYIVIYLSNYWSGGSNQGRWLWNIQYLRQGWNILTMRGADVVDSVEGTGDAPFGARRMSDLGTGFDWTGSLEYVELEFTNFPNGTVVHADQIRTPAKAKAVMTIGFDAIGASANDNIMYSKVAALFAQYGIKSYCTMTYVYDILYEGNAGWTRFQKLQDEYGWEAIPHTWSHGGTTVGGSSTLTSLTAASDLVTVTYPAAHNIALGRKYKSKIYGASISAANGVFELTATTSTQATYTAAGAGTGTATGTIKLNTYLSEVLGTDTTENRRLCDQEFLRNVQVMKSNGYAPGTLFVAYPNNAVPHLDVMQATADKAGIKVGRGYRGGYTFLDECGIDNPLHMGSFIMDNGATLATKTSYIQGKVAGAISRGCHLHIFGHYIYDDEDPANAAYAPVSPDDPPGQNGNPAVPVSGGQGGGWWYLSQLRTLIEDTIAPAIAAGELVVMSPSEYATYIGGPINRG